ncbi:MAG: ABC transporter ATP-binding protein [Chitinispirillaceae bacterium]
MSTCIACKDLHISFSIQKETAKAVSGVSFELNDKETLGIVGESGCGKSVTALSIMRLIPTPPGKIESGQIHFEDKELLRLPEREMRRIRGQRISMIFQDPMTSLNPVFTCGNQIDEVLRLHKGMTKTESADHSRHLLSEVGIADPLRAYSSYPHQLSGGMRQRVMIAMALACSPRLLIADEPTTALDVTVQARLLELMRKLQDTKDMSMILITHNLGIVADMAHKILVMYAGEVMESATAEEIFDSPGHPYTQCLLDTIPLLGKKKERLTVIPGDVPTPLQIPSGCPFHPRCPKVFDRCRQDHPELNSMSENHLVRCHLYE